ncbi:MAG TPA: DMT family transporter [Gemmatimonadales bacterium]|nr:DMT family transporter [Gemmatimonadales bacterium]
MTRPQAILALWVACVIWGAAFPLTKLVLHDASPMAFTAARFLVATLLVAPLLRDLRPEEWRGGAVLGGLLSVGFACQTIGLLWTTASRSGFLTSLYIPFTPLIVLLVYRRLPDRRALVGLALAVAGMIVLTHPRHLESGLNRGDGLTILCAFAFAAHMVATGYFATRARVLQLMMAQVAVSAVLTGLATPLIEVPRLSPTPFVLGMVAYEALLASLIAIRLQIAAQQVLSPTYAALVFTLEPVIAALSSLALLGDRLSPLQWLGGAGILVGSLLPEWQRRAEDPPTR